METRAVEVAGNLSKSIISKGQTVSFFLSISNHTSAPILSVRLAELHAEDLEIQELSWCGTTILANCDPITSGLEPGQSVAVWGELIARNPHEPEAVMAKISWIGPNKALSSRFVPVGQVTIRTSAEQWQSSWTYVLQKDLALPVVLLVLATALGIYDKHRENRRLRADKDLEEARRQDAELRAQTAQTWTSMLPESHKMATQYYMPVDGAASALIDEHTRRIEALKTRNQKAQQAAEGNAFYYLVLMFSRLRALSDKRGGWYFKNRVGEQLVGRCMEEFRLLFFTDQPSDFETRWSNAVGLIDPRVKLGAFTNKLQANDNDGSLLKSVQTDFLTWLNSSHCDHALRMLKAGRILLSYEMNRPYAYWYGEREKVTLEEEIKKTLREAARPHATYPPIPDEDVSSYLAEIQGLGTQ